MTGQALLLLSDHASYMTGGEYFVDGYVLPNASFKDALLQHYWGVDTFCAIHSGQLIW